MQSNRITIPVHVTLYEHPNGNHLSVYATDAEAQQDQADTARKYWEDRHDLDMSDEHEGLSDEAVCEAYFNNHETEFWTSQVKEIQVDPGSISEINAMLTFLKMMARLETTEDFEYRGACMENDDAVDTVDRLISEARDLLHRSEWDPAMNRSIDHPLPEAPGEYVIRLWSGNTYMD